MADIKKEQRVWVALKNGIQETLVKSVGSSYITLECNPKIKFYRDTLRQVNGTGVSQFIILDLEKYETDKYYANLIDKMGKVAWGSVEREDLDKIAEILRDY